MCGSQVVLVHLARPLHVTPVESLLPRKMTNLLKNQLRIVCLHQKSESAAKDVACES